MKYRAKTTFQHNGGLYVSGDDVPLSGKLADVLVKLGRVESYSVELDSKPQKPKSKRKGTYKRRDMKVED